MKKVIIVVSSHGVIPVKKIGDELFVSYLRMPANMTLTSVSESAPGICTIYSPVHINEKFEYLQTVVMSNDLSLSSSTSNFIKEVIAEFIKIDENNFFNPLKSKRLMKELQKELPVSKFQDFTTVLRHSNKRYNISSAVPSLRRNSEEETESRPVPNKVIDKEYVLYSTDNKNDFKISMIYSHTPVDLFEVVDLFDVLENKTIEEGEEIDEKGQKNKITITRLKLSDIVKELHEKWDIEEIILFDLSCSSFIDVPERETRCLRRNITKKIGGRKKVRGKTNRKLHRKNKHMRLHIRH
jgi:hypothetical protein